MATQSAASGVRVTTDFTPFQKHLQFYAKTGSSPPKITIASALKASLRLGLNLPVSLFLALALRTLYAPFPYYWSPVDIATLPASKLRTQLEASNTHDEKRSYSRADLSQMAEHPSNNGQKGLIARMIDKGHVIGFWSMAADIETGLVAHDDLKRFQKGDWQEAVAMRRRFRKPQTSENGDHKAEVLPFLRGGPGSVAGHSWVVRKFFGVKVYE